MADNTANRSTSVRAPRKSRTTVATSPQMFTAAQVASIVAHAASSTALAMAGIANGVQTQSIIPNSADITGSNITNIGTAPRKRSSTTTPGKPGRKPTAGSGLGRARELFAKMQGQQQNTADSFRKTVVTAFKEELKLRPEIANTYYHVIAGKKNGGTTRGRRKKVATPDITPQAATA